ncbi:YnfA family protein [Candidatus Gracilibacteria bacterium]|nr:YnfA family protein [Candidatus Gracilibacteria bacterium]
MSSITKFRKVIQTLFFFVLAGIFEIGGGYLIWLWLRDGWDWTYGLVGGLLLFLYGIVPTFQPAYFHRVYAAYGGVFIVMAMLWAWIFDGTRPDFYDTLGASIALFGVFIIFYWPRKNEKIWSK